MNFASCLLKRCDRYVPNPFILTIRDYPANKLSVAFPLKEAVITPEQLPTAFMEKMKWRWEGN
jgi:hypothetical protein